MLDSQPVTSNGNSLPAKKSNKTLIIIIVIVGIFLLCGVIIAIIAGLGSAGIDKAQGQARNTKREADVMDMSLAFEMYYAENGNFMPDFGNIPLCSSSTVKIGTGSGMIDIMIKLGNEYINKIPTDPSLLASEDAFGDSGYTICRVSNKKMRIIAPLAEDGKVIQREVGQ